MYNRVDVLILINTTQTKQKQELVKWWSNINVVFIEKVNRRYGRTLQSIFLWEYVTVYISSSEWYALIYFPD